MTAGNTSLINTKNPNGFALPGVTLESRKVLQELLAENHHKFHIFFNEKQFHNHIPHQLMAAAALGAQPDTLRQIYKIHSQYQKPQMPVKYDINDDNVLDYYAKEDAYSSYLAFFDKKLETMSIEEAFAKYGTLPPIFDGLLGGLFHPLIHFCYGLEFSEKMVAAEGLAMAAIQMQDPGFRVEELESFDNLQIETKSVVQILDDIRNDPVLIENVKYGIGTTYAAASTTECSSRILKHVSQFHVAVDEQEITEKMKEIYVAIVDLYAASQRQGKKYQLDFFIMHFLTSVYFVHVLLPSLPLKDQAKLLKAYFAKVCQWFVARGSPKVDRSVVYNHKTLLSENENPWFEVWNMGIRNMDLHVVKVVRALSKADELYASDQDLYYCKAAQMTVEATAGRDPLDNVWGRKPVGFDEAWEDE